MYLVAFDTETALSRRGKQAPELVCVSIAGIDASDIEKCAATGFVGWRLLLNAEKGAQYLADCLSRNDVILVSFNAAFDTSVLGAAEPSQVSAIFDKYANDQIACGMLRAKLLALADGALKARSKAKIKLAHETVGSFSLAGCMHNTFGIDRSAGKAAGAWRYRFHELSNIAIEDWPKEAREYAQTDADDHLRLYCAQWLDKWKATLVDEYRQARAAFGLRLQEVWGVRTDGAAVATAQGAAQARVYELETELKQTCAACYTRIEPLPQGAFICNCGNDFEGLLRQNGSQNQAALQGLVTSAYRELGEKVPLTAGGKEGKNKKPSLSGDALEGSGHPLLLKIAESGDAKRLLSNYLPMLLEGVNGPFHWRYNSILDTGRTSSSPNVQNPPRIGPVRECYVPRPGYDFASNDYNQVELCTFGQAQIWLTGKSEIAKAINNGLDCHSYLGSILLGISYEAFLARLKAGDAECEQQRQLAKVPNFGYPGGMGPAKLVEFAWKTYGLVISMADAKRFKRVWEMAWAPQEYFRVIHNEIGRNKTATVAQLRSGRIRGDVWFTADCNTKFQGLAADGAKEAIFDVARKCYADRSSALYDSRPVLFLHDELILEVPNRDREQRHFACYELSDTMNQAMCRWVPDVKISSSPALMRRWYKKAKEVYDADGFLIPWEPRAKG